MTDPTPALVKVPCLLAPGHDQDCGGAAILDFRDVPDMAHYSAWLEQLQSTDERWVKYAALHKLMECL